MPELPPPYYTSPRGQCAVILLAALRDLYVNDSYGVVTKQQAIAHIKRMHWFAIEPEDLKPYRSQLEPRWHTLIAWARKDSVLRDLISNEGRDKWGLTHLGRNVIERFHEKCRAGERPVAECFLWSQGFKKFICPGHEPSSEDVKRPAHFYREHTLAEFLAELLAEN